MEYQKYEFRVNSVSYEYYSDKHINYDIDDYVTLGFKVNKPVLRYKQPPKEVKSVQPQSIIVNKQMVGNSTEKKAFIYINGKKVFVVPTKLNVVPLKFPLKPPLTKCLGQPSHAKEHSDQQNCYSPMILRAIKPYEQTSIKCEEIAVKSVDHKSIDVKIEEDCVPCNFATDSDAASDLSPELQASPDSLTCKNDNTQLKTYSNSSNKKNIDAPSDAQQINCSVIDYERRVMSNMRTYKLRKSVSTSCEDLYKSVDVSTETIKTVDNSTQTDLDTGWDDEFINSLLSNLDSNEQQTIISVADSGIHANTSGTQESTCDKIMQQFHDDFKNCMTYDTKGNLPIHEGVLANDIKLVQRNSVVLKARQESVNILNHDNLTPLQLAILNDTNEDIIELLLEHGADLGAMDTEGNNILHLAIENGRLRALEIMMKFAKKKNFNIDTFNYEGLSPLMLCCINGAHGIAKLLLNNGADPNLRDLKSGRTALFHASENHDLEMIKLLLKHKADTKIRNFFGTSPHDAMFEVEDIPKDIKLLILGKESHIKIQPRKRSHGDRLESKKKIKYAAKTLQVVSTIQRIGSRVSIIQKNSK